MQQRQQLSASRRWIIKIGSALLTADGRGLDSLALQRWVDQIAAIRAAGIEVVLVSSGAVAEGMSRMGWSQRPAELHELQAAAAIGQMGLVQAWESCFQTHGLHTAQVLLTHDDLSNRKRYINARSTLCSLLKFGVVPVVNENDTVAFDELRLGDNDNLAALVANLLEADVLVILTDQHGLFSADPREQADAELIQSAAVSDARLDVVAGEGSGVLGRGGMRTKLEAARRAARSGTATLIANGREDDVLPRLLAGEQLGTFLYTDEEPLTARKRWMAGQLQVMGQLVLDDGAVRVLRESGKSLLPVGVKSVSGEFGRGELLECLSLAGEVVARGLVNYTSAQCAQIAGRPSKEIGEILGFVGAAELIHRDNLVLV